MKIQCNACEAAEATVLCCADEAALCAACDEKVHAANKLASKHQRVPLASSTSHMPKCDICQETVGYFFCLEDRALLCRRCDVAIHSANQFVAAHLRFLLTGVKVGLETTEPAISQPKENQCVEKATPTEKITRLSQSKLAASKKGVSMSKASQNVEGTSKDTEGTSNNIEGTSQHNNGGGLPATATSFTNGSSLAGIIPEWPIEYLFGLDTNQNYAFIDQSSSKADNGKNSDSDWSPFYRESVDTGFDTDECLNHTADISWTVPEVPSPPTASGLHWPKNTHQIHADHSVYVPDICSSRYPTPFDHDQVTPTITKRRRHF